MTRKQLNAVLKRLEDNKTEIFADLNTAFIINYLDRESGEMGTIAMASGCDLCYMCLSGLRNLYEAYKDERTIEEFADMIRDKLIKFTHEYLVPEGAVKIVEVEEGGNDGTDNQS